MRCDPRSSQLNTCAEISVIYDQPGRGYMHQKTIWHIVKHIYGLIFRSQHHLIRLIATFNVNIRLNKVEQNHSNNSITVNQCNVTRLNSVLNTELLMNIFISI